MVSFKEMQSLTTQRNVPLDELLVSEKVVYLASSKVDQLVALLVLAER